jgi:hypothetical protein
MVWEIEIEKPTDKACSDIIGNRKDWYELVNGCDESVSCEITKSQLEKLIANPPPSSVEKEE